MIPMEIAGICIPDSKLARDVTQLIRDMESKLLFHHSCRVYFWGAMSGKRKGLIYDPELLYIASMFHDLGLTAPFAQSHLRFEVDGANAARDFLQARGIGESEIETVWNAVALHTTPGIPEFMRPEIALLQAGAGMDVAGRGFDQFPDAERNAVVAALPRETNFKSEIVDAFYHGMKHRPETTFGTFNDDFLAAKDPQFKRVNMCSVICNSRWEHQDDPRA